MAPPNLESGVLVWRKKLPASDALQVQPGSKHVGGVRLTQAKFEIEPGIKIDQTTYFRQLFSGYKWTQETGRHRENDQEHCFVPMRVVIPNRDLGIHTFEITHKPSGEAQQGNYTDSLRWGGLIPTIMAINLTNHVFSLYETPDAGTDFLIVISKN
ncbi:hypothetical protein LP420_21750 [Massilia sp. B-10]|nr:hypothetical protein LP420_21750 [Massilia sp. B-10]UUZ52165.1 hypothetical protein LP419_21235 [Massilia sp. H-1]